MTISPISLATHNSPPLAFSWLLRLRWGAVCSQILTIFAVWLFFDIEIPFSILLVIIIFEAASNLSFHYLQSQGLKITDHLLAAVMLLDILLLTTLLYYTGGPMNPFTFLYLIHVALGAILLRPRWSWTLALFTTMNYLGLFLLSRSGVSQQSLSPSLSQIITLCHIDANSLSFVEDKIKLHLHGMWVAFCVTALFIVFFIGRIQQALADQQKTTDDLKAQKVRNEKLASLATLAAGAAHEFSTPLSTIAVAAGEMLHTLRQRQDEPELLDDAKLIRSQVERCKDILYQMTADAGEHMGEETETFSIEEIIDEALATLTPPERDRITVINETGGLTARLPLRTMGRVVRGLVKNGLDASAAGGAVRLRSFSDQRYLYLEVTDQGHGMDPETATRATEPFFTNKEPGKGLGLGLFLAKLAAERFGGDIRIKSTQDHGTTVTLFVARDRTNPSE